MDLRDSLKITWKDIVASSIESLGRMVDLERLEGDKKTSNNPNFKGKIRQLLHINPNLFVNIERGVWRLV